MARERVAQRLLGHCVGVALLNELKANLDTDYQPVGWVEIRFSSPNGGEFIAGGSLQFRGKEVVELPRALLACMRGPRVGSTGLNTVYVIPEAGEAAWFEAFWTRVVIPYGYLYDRETGAVSIDLFRELHLEYVGNTLRRVVAARSATEKEVLDAVPSGAQCESLATMREGVG